MDEQLQRLTTIGELFDSYGKELVLALAVLVFGLILARVLIRLIRLTLQRFTEKQSVISSVSNALHILMIMIVVATALEAAGMHTIIIRRILASITMAAVGLIVIFRPYIPTLPFKVGNTIKTGDLLGKVEATTFLNTRLKTFDGKTVFVPNRKILDDYLINYHFTPTRRVKINVGIRYDQDILRAKQVLEAIMIEDPRVKTTPRPVVYVLNLTDSYVALGGRCWVDNLKYWVTKCELAEKVKLRFDREGIIFAFPQRDVHLYHETQPTAFSEAGFPKTISIQPGVRSTETG
jgi:small conductance mechanosensitive channel